MDKLFSIGICAAAILSLGACGGGGKSSASSSASAASASTTCPTTTTTTSSTGVVTVTVTPCPAASSPSTTASSPSSTASSPSTTASSPSSTASSPSSTASSPATSASSPATTAGPYGLWNGSTSTSRNIYGLILPDGNYYLFYTGVGTSTFSGILIGHGTTTPAATAGTGSFVAAAPDAWDYSLEGSGAQSATMPNTQYAAGQSLSGTLHYAASSSDVAFQAAYDSRYAATPTLASLAGTFAGNAASLSTGVGSASLVFGANGTITGTAANCAITGTATPRTDGNAFNITLSFGAAPCLLPNQTLTGAGFYSVAIKQILLAAPTADRSDGFLVIANKP